MTKIKTAGFIKSISGRLGSDSDIVAVTNKITGETHYRKYKKPTKPRTEKQKANSIAFKEMSEKVTKWIRDNEPSENYPEGTLAYKETRKAYYSQHTIGKFNAYIWKNFDKLPK